MDWLLDNIQFLIIAGAAIAWWLNKRRETAALEKEAEEQLSQPQSRSSADADDAERARRIQEEIRRKIAERRTLPPVARPVVIEEWSQPRTTTVEPPVIVDRGYDAGAAYREQQRQLQEKIRLVEETRRRAAEIQRQMSPISGGAMATTKPHEPVTGLRAALRNRSEIRRAIVLREILGTPKGLQG